MSKNETQLTSGQGSGNPIIPAQVRIGVSGHRNLPNKEGVINAVKKVLNSIDELLEKNMPNGTPYQYVIVSPLAEGADRIVADVVLNRRRKDEADKPILEVPLPVPVVEYKKTFDGGASSEKEFDDLAVKAEKIELLPPTKRDDRYVQVGQHVVRNCDVLIAIWDGEKSKGQGGTQNIVEYAREKGRALFWINSTTLEITRENFDKDTFEPFKQLDTYNGERTKDLSNKIEERKNKIIEKIENNKPLRELVSAILDVLIPYWAKASVLATQYQKYYFWTGTTIYGLSVVAVATVAIQSLFFSKIPQILFLEVGFMGLILLIIWMSIYFGWHRKWTDYRMLVERFRALTYMRIAELECSPLEAPALKGDWVVRAFDHVLKKLRFKVFCSSDTSLSCPSGVAWGIKNPVDDILRLSLINAWVKDQQEEFYGESSIKQGKQNENLAYWVSVLFRITFFAALLHAWNFEKYVEEYLRYFDKILIGIAIICPAFGAAINGIRVHRELHRNAERYGVMDVYLGDLIDQINLVGDKSDFNRLINAAYEAMFQENIDWRLTFFSRRPEVP